MGKLAFLLSRVQASQYPGMGRDLADNFPEAKGVFEDADVAVGFSGSSKMYAVTALKMS